MNPEMSEPIGPLIPPLIAMWAIFFWVFFNGRQRVINWRKRRAKRRANRG